MVAIGSVGVLRRCILTLALYFLGSGLTSSRVVAQVHTNCAGPTCNGNVTVTPHAASRSFLANSTADTIKFDVNHTGPAGVSVTYTLTCTATGGVACVSVTPASMVLTGTDVDQFASVKFNLGSTAGTLKFKASSSNGGSDSALVTIGIPANPSGIALRNFNRDNRTRGTCLTAGAGEAAAWECGDLIVTHGTPGYATLGKARSLTLLYNSAQAAPSIAVAATITQGAANQGLPDSVSVRLSAYTGAGWVSKDSASYSGWAGAPAPSRQVVLRFRGGPGADSLPSGIYPIRLLVKNLYQAASLATMMIEDTVLLVNRHFSPYGSGWSVEGVEHLVFNQPVGTGSSDILWIGGDGSAQWYRRRTGADSMQWVAPKGAFQDTLVKTTGPVRYTRTLRHGIKVVFDANGNHIQTINRQLQSTVFTWNANGGLDTVKVPPSGAARTTYLFTYTSSSGKLDKITDPVGRILDATVNGSGQLTTLVDPDTSVATSFGYDASNRLTSRTNRRGFVTSYVYANNLRVTKAFLPGAVAAGDTIVYQPWDEKGLAVSLSGQTAVDTAQAFTKVLGPRVNVADDASVWVDKWGAPLRATNPLGQTVTLVRDSMSPTPALVTRVIGADGRIWTNTFDARGNLTQSRDSTLHLAFGQPTLVWTYTYHDTLAKDSPDNVVDPAGLVSIYHYNHLGLDSIAIAPNGHVSGFEFKGDSDPLRGLLVAVTERAVPTWNNGSLAKISQDLRTEFAYDSLGNVLKDSNDVSARVFSVTRDALERVANSFDGAGHHTEYAYDPANRLLATKVHIEEPGIRDSSSFPADSFAVSPLTTTNSFVLGLLTKVRDPRNVNRSYEYDPAGRPMVEMDWIFARDSTWFSPSGQVDSVRKRSGARIRYFYDAAGQDTMTTWPSGSKSDTVWAQYDVANRLVRMKHSNGQVIRRTWYPNGLLRTELDSVSGNIVLQRFAYDQAGRRTIHVVTADSTATTTDSMEYRYDAVSGALKTIWVQWRNAAGDNHAVDSVQFAWDPLGRRDSIGYPGIRSALHYAYDANGALRVLCGINNGSFTGLSYIQYDSVVDLDGLVRKTLGVPPAAVGSNMGCRGVSVDLITDSTMYDVRHQMILAERPGGVMTFRYDGSGNRIRERLSGAPATFRRSESIGYETNLLQSAADSTSDGNVLNLVYSYDQDGKRIASASCYTPPCTPVANENIYYDGVGRVDSVRQVYCPSLLGNAVGAGCSAYWNGYSDCKYDALGRLSISCSSGTPHLAVTYDGANVVRASSFPTGPTAGWSFVQGPGIDDPLLGYYPYQHMHTYYMTAPGGRQLAVVDTGGFRVETTDAYVRFGGALSGAVQASTTFGAARQAGVDAPELSFFRNRVYDQLTGRWLQEDPIGLAGGTNLFQFNGNNPAMFTDPFGMAQQSSVTTANCPRDWDKKKCDEWIKKAIEALKADTAQVCRDRGRLADSLFKQNLIWSDNQTDDYGYVYPDPDPARAATGASVPPIYLGDLSFVNLAETKNTLAHEGTHIAVDSSGTPQNDRRGGMAYQVGDKCGQ